MTAALTQQLIEAKQNLRMQEKLQSKLKLAKRALADALARHRELETELQKEDRDLKKLEGLSLAGLFYEILGSKEQQIEKERQEFLAAKLKFDQFQHAIASLRREISELESQIGDLGDVVSEYRALLAEKEKLITSTQGEQAQQLARLSEKLADAQADRHEIREAIQAGKALIERLKDVIRALKSAGGWGTWDMAGGGFFATAMKYSEIDAAKQAFDQAQDLLLRFQHELADVDSGPGVGPFDEFDASERFADYFLDNILTDWIVQSKIDSSLATVIRMQRTVWEVLQRLAESYEIAGNTVDEMSAQRRALIEADL